MRRLQYGSGVILSVLAMSASTSAALEITPEARIILSNSVAGDTESAWNLLFDGMAGGQIRHSFEFRQTELDTGAQIRLRLIQNVRSRPGFAGRLGETCQTVTDGDGLLSCVNSNGNLFRAPVSATTGLSAFGPALSGGLRFVPELARVWLGGSWGEVFAGLDVGVADLLDARPRRLFAEIGSFSGSLDPTGLDGVRSANDISGTAAKLGYTSPRLLGFKAGLSWTPGHASGVRRYLPPDGAYHARPDLRHIVELGLSFARRFYRTGIRTRLGLTYSTGTDVSPYAEYGQYHAVGTGLELEYHDWHYGLRWLYSNNALAAGNGHYNAVETGLSYQTGQWRFGIEFGWAEDLLINIESLTYAVGAIYEINEFFQLGLGFVSGQALLERTNITNQNLRGSGPVLEMRLKLP